MKAFILFLFITIFCLVTKAEIYPTQITFGSTFNGDAKQISIKTSGPFSVTSIPVWLTVAPLSGTGPNSVGIVADVTKVPSSGATAIIQIVTNAGVDQLTVLAKCSSSSGCTGGTTTPQPTAPTATPAPTPVPNPTPTPIPNPTPSPSLGVTAPLRPTYQDVTTKLDKIQPYKWYRGKSPTQTQIDAMEETRTGIAVPEALRFARALGCTSTLDKYAAILGEITGLLGPVYEVGISLSEGESGRWFTDISGKHYGKENYTFRAVRTCALNNPNSCATSPLATQNLQDLLDIRIVAGKCVAGSLFALIPPSEPRNSAREKIGKVQADTLMPPLTENQKSLLAASHAAHHAVTLYKCGEGPQPPAGIVGSSHMAFEASARTEDEHHFFRMKDFSGAEDPLWTREEICRFAKLQDRAHHQWKDEVLKGRWGRSRLFENDHQNMHICMGLKHDRLKIRMSCPTKINSCPLETCESYMRRQVL